MAYTICHYDNLYIDIYNIHAKYNSMQFAIKYMIEYAELANLLIFNTQSRHTYNCFHMQSCTA